MLVREAITHHSGAGQQLAVAGLLPAVLQGVGALGRFAPQHNVFAFLHGAFGVAPGLGWLHYGERRDGGERLREGKNNRHDQVATWH